MPGNHKQRRAQMIFWSIMSIVSQFIKGTSSLRLVSNHVNMQRVLVLDSSFNPPTKGHLSVILQALKHFGPSQVILMLSINNVDKAAQPELFEVRVQLMELMAGYLRQRSVASSVCLTKHAKFVDKYKALRLELPEQQLVFLVGQDTIVRIFNPKYYESLLSEELGEFMTGSMLFSVGRNGQRSEECVPSQWVNRVVFEDHEDEGLSTVSSSKVRKAISEAKAGFEGELDSMLIESIKEEILRQGYYKKMT